MLTMWGYTKTAGRWLILAIHWLCEYFENTLSENDRVFLSSQYTQTGVISPLIARQPVNLQRDIVWNTYSTVRGINFDDRVFELLEKRQGITGKFGTASYKLLAKGTECVCCIAYRVWMLIAISFIFGFFASKFLQ